MTTEMKQTLLTEYQISNLLGIKQRTLQALRLSGRGPKYIKLSNRIIRYQLSDIKKWLEEQQDKDLASK